tara:strand:- start:109 stop:273 length:165 start_codon:yes stop_codon:yes gene_type:complete
MTLENCKRLLEHYEEIGNAEAAAEMKVHIERKEKLPKYAGIEPEKEKTKSKKGK